MVMVIIIVVDVFLVVFHLIQFIECNLYVPSQSFEFSDKRSEHGKKPQYFCVLCIGIKPEVKKTDTLFISRNSAHLLNFSKGIML